MVCEYQERVKAYLQSEAPDPQLEAHIARCPQCTAFAEGYLQRQQERPLALPCQRYDGSDQVLRSQIGRYKQGRSRIILFTLFGLVMGWFSIYYISDPFIVTKIITALPYKLNEMVYTAFLGLGRATSQYSYFPEGGRVVSFLAERLTPALIGGALYGSLGYFTGSKRIFTLQRYLRFAVVWLLLIAAAIGGLFAVNGYYQHKNQTLPDISGYGVSYNGLSGGRRGVQGVGADAPLFDQLNAALGQAAEWQAVAQGISPGRREDSIAITFYLGGVNQRVVTGRVYPETGILSLDNGLAYQVPAAFVTLVADCYQYPEEYLQNRARIHPAEGGEGQ